MGGPVERSNGLVGSLVSPVNLLSECCSNSWIAPAQEYEEDGSEQLQTMESGDLASDARS